MGGPGSGGHNRTHGGAAKPKPILRPLGGVSAPWLMLDNPDAILQTMLEYFDRLHYAVPDDLVRNLAQAQHMLNIATEVYNRWDLERRMEGCDADMHEMPVIGSSKVDAHVRNCHVAVDRLWDKVTKLAKLDEAAAKAEEERNDPTNKFRGTRGLRVVAQ